MGPKRIAVVVLAVIAVIGVVIAVIAGAIAVLPRHNRFAAGAQTSYPAPPSPVSPAATPAGASPTATAATPTVPKSDLPRPVLAAASPRVVPNKAAVANKIRAVTVKGVTGSYSGSVVDVTTGKVLYAHNATRGYIPASTMKLLTSTAALSILRPDHTFKTSVVSPKRGQIILVGGGDPYLARQARSDYPKRATITGLARAAARELKQDKTSKVSLGYDASLFKGPAWNSRWPGFYGDQVSRTSALWVDEGHVGYGGVRYKDPAKEAATAFAAALSKQGIKVTGTHSARAPKAAPVVARVSSMSLERIVEHLLMVSDNDAAEVIFRQAAIGAGIDCRGDKGRTGRAHQARHLGCRHDDQRRERAGPADQSACRLHGQNAAGGRWRAASRAPSSDHRAVGGRSRGQPEAPVLRRPEPGWTRGGTRQDRHAEQSPGPRGCIACHGRVGPGVRVLDQQAEERVQRHDLA